MQGIGDKPSTRPSAAEVSAAKRRLQKIVLMEWVMPSGKRLGDYTGKECAAEGGWLTAVSERIGPRGVVRKKLSEQDLIDIRDGKTT
jgi:hypothetical protein